MLTGGGAFREGVALIVSGALSPLQRQCQVMPSKPGFPSMAMILVPMAGIHIVDIEAAINFWRARSPSPDGVELAAPLRALAEVYAMLVFYQEAEADEQSMPPEAFQAWMVWFESLPDTPCIAICSTSQGDDVCKGCGRSFDEVQRWTEMSPAEKRRTWRRITLEGQAWRFNRYAERALEDAPVSPTDERRSPPGGDGSSA